MRRVTLYLVEATDTVVFLPVEDLYWIADNTVLVVDCPPAPEGGGHRLVQFPRERLRMIVDEPEAVLFLPDGGEEDDPEDLPERAPATEFFRPPVELGGA